MPAPRNLLEIKSLRSRQPRGGQCPSCYTFNIFDHLPPSKKVERQHAGDSVWGIICALCGSEYSLQSEAPAPVAA